MVAKQKDAIKGPVTLQGVPTTYATRNYETKTYPTK
jgi:hypothetical protein